MNTGNSAFAQPAATTESAAALDARTADQLREIRGPGRGLSPDEIDARRYTYITAQRAFLSAKIKDEHVVRTVEQIRAGQSGIRPLSELFCALLSSRMYSEGASQSLVDYVQSIRDLRLDDAISGARGRSELSGRMRPVNELLAELRTNGRWREIFQMNSDLGTWIRERSAETITAVMQSSLIEKARAKNSEFSLVDQSGAVSPIGELIVGALFYSQVAGLSIASPYLSSLADGTGEPQTLIGITSWGMQYVVCAINERCLLGLTRLGFDLKEFEHLQLVLKRTPHPKLYTLGDRGKLISRELMIYNNISGDLAQALIGARALQGVERVLEWLAPNGEIPEFQVPHNFRSADELSVQLSAEPRFDARILHQETGRAIGLYSVVPDPTGGVPSGTPLGSWELWDGDGEAYAPISALAIGSDDFAPEITLRLGDPQSALKRFADFVTLHGLELQEAAPDVSAMIPSLSPSSLLVEQNRLVLTIPARFESLVRAVLPMGLSSPADPVDATPCGTDDSDARIDITISRDFAAGSSECSAQAVSEVVEPRVAERLSFDDSFYRISGSFDRFLALLQKNFEVTVNTARGKGSHIRLYNGGHSTTVANHIRKGETPFCPQIARTYLEQLHISVDEFLGIVKSLDR